MANFIKSCVKIYIGVYLLWQLLSALLLLAIVSGLFILLYELKLFM